MTGPDLAARLDAAGDRIAREILARHTYPREVLDRVAALLGPVPKARKQDAASGADTTGGHARTIPITGNYRKRGGQPSRRA